MDFPEATNLKKKTRVSFTGRECQISTSKCIHVIWRGIRGRPCNMKGAQGGRGNITSIEKTYHVIFSVPFAFQSGATIWQFFVSRNICKFSIRGLVYQFSGLIFKVSPIWAFSKKQRKKSRTRVAPNRRLWFRLNPVRSDRRIGESTQPEISDFSEGAISEMARWERNRFRGEMPEHPKPLWKKSFDFG